MTAHQSVYWITVILDKQKGAAAGNAVIPRSGMEWSRPDPARLKLPDDAEDKSSKSARDKMQHSMMRCSGNTLLVKPCVTEMPLLYAASWLGVVPIQRWSGRLWPSPWADSHYTLFSAEQGRHEQKRMAQGVFLSRIPAPAHGMFTRPQNARQGFSENGQDVKSVLEHLGNMT